MKHEEKLFSYTESLQVDVITLSIRLYLPQEVAVLITKIAIPQQIKKASAVSRKP